MHGFNLDPKLQINCNREAIPLQYCCCGRFGITATARRYLEPLIQGEAYPPYRRGLPDYVELKGVSVARKLPPMR